MVRHPAQVIPMEELVAMAEDRSRIYWMLSRLFLVPPDAELLGTLAAARIDASGNAGAIDVALVELRAGMASTDLDALRIEHLRLFGGVREGYGPPPPYESLYREGRMFGESTESVISHYRANGVSLADEPAAPEDHLGLELKYVALLCHRESRLWQDGDAAGGIRVLEAQHAFVEQHLHAWVPAYCLKLHDETGSSFYRAVARLTSAAIEFDARQVADMVSELTGTANDTYTQGGLQ